LGQAGEAEQLALRAEGIFEELAAANRGERAGSAANRQILASIYLGQHRYEDAEKMLQRADGGGDALHAVMGYSNLSVAALGVKDNARAEEYDRRAIEMAERDLPARHTEHAAAITQLREA
jgi:hypothetical protein